MQAHEAKIHQIFDRNTLLYIPFFQRSYVWDEDDWQRLLDDLVGACRANKHHFLGSVILKREWPKDPNPIGWSHMRQVIDGQQRLTTLMILMRVVSIINNKYKTYENTFYEIDDDIEELRLHHNVHDNDAFRYVTSLKELKDISEGLKGNIADAYEFFRKHITPEIAEVIDTKRLADLLDFVLVLVDEGENEQQIFDSINSLGVRLTTAELLKNHIFAENDIELYKETWFKTFEEGAEVPEFWAKEITLGRLKKAAIDNFLYAYLQIKINDGSFEINSAEKDSFQKYDKLFDSLKEMIKRRFGDDRIGVLPELIKYAEHYKEKINPEIADKPSPAKPCVERILSIAMNMDVSTLMPYILYVMYNVDDMDEQNAIFGVLEGYVMRRMVTKDTNKNYNRFFTEGLIGNNILTADGLKGFLLDSSAEYPSDEDLERGFLGTQFKQNTQPRGILYYIESALHEDQYQSMPLYSLSTYSLEHMLPRTWRGTVWEDGADEKRKDSAMLTLGNMTIVKKSLNSSMRNSEWTVKLDMDGEKGLFHNASGLKTMAGVFSLPAWNEDEIENRAKRLYELAKSVWPYISTE